MQIIGMSLFGRIAFATVIALSFLIIYNRQHIDGDNLALGTESQSVYEGWNGQRITAATPGIDIQFAHTRSVWRVVAALFLAWLIMALWHGASWNFALWGLWHATFIFAYRLLAPFLSDSPGRIGNFFGWGITVLIAMLGWIPFRAPNVETAFSLWRRLLDLSS